MTTAEGPRRLSLRARLLGVTLALVALALGATGWATHAALGTFLVDRVDQELAGSHLEAARRALFAPGPPGPGLPAGAFAVATLPVGQRIADTDPDRETVSLPDTLPRGTSTQRIDGREYRVLTLTDRARVADATPGVATPRGGAAPLVVERRLVVAVPLDEVNGTLRRLLWIQLGVGLAALGALGALALWLVRLGLRPLDDIEATARAIAAGDLTQRVADDDPRTEVGRVGATLNAMLHDLQQAFAARLEQQERLRRFVADASHELQTPLTSVRGYAELFRRGGADRPEDLATIMRRIEAESARMGVLVDDLLVLADLDGDRPTAQAAVALAPLVSDMVADARAVEPAREITLAATANPLVHGSDGQLRQVVANLLANVRVHTPPEAPVEVRLAADHSTVTLEIADRGPGVPPELVDQIFERFVRADPSRTRASGGSGLGLSIVASIIGDHGGRVSARNRTGGGLVVTVNLPLDSAPIDHDRADPTGPTPSTR